MRKGDGRVVPNFINQALSGEELTIYGDGNHTRSFCYIDDLVDGILLLLERGDADPVNLGNDKEVSILEFARMVVKLTGSSSKLGHEPLPVDDPKVRQPDISKAKGLLGWEPKIPLEEGLGRTIAFFKKTGNR
jgi:dTDP-glucose 4,6-dehydratase